MGWMDDQGYWHPDDGDRQTTSVALWCALCGASVQNPIWTDGRSLCADCYNRLHSPTPLDARLADLERRVTRLEEKL
jgi:protein-arginine kinase activator protein McsA